MDWQIWVGLVIVVPITVFGLIRLPRIWAGRDRELMVLGTSALPLSEPLRRGFVRGSVVGLFVCTALVVCGVAVAVADVTTGRVASVSQDVGFGALMVVCVLGLINAGVLLFNRPKFVVPPCYRTEPGAVPMWWRMIRGRRRS